MSMPGDYKTVVAALTAAAGTTQRLDKRGFTKGCVFNESGGAVAITYYASAVKNGTPLPAEDSGNTAVPAQTLGDDECCDLPAALAGMPYIYPVLGSGTANITFHFEVG